MREALPKALAVGKRIAEARNKVGLSQAALAGKVGVTLGAIGQYEIGRNLPRLKRLEAIAEVLGVTTGWLLTGDEPDEQVRAQTANEAEALRIVRDLPEDQQETALAVLKAMAGRVRKE